jgi:hypothetical protein
VPLPPTSTFLLSILSRMVQSVVVSTLATRPTKYCFSETVVGIIGVLCCLLTAAPSRTYGETTQKWSKVASNGETVIAARSRTMSVRVRIVTREVEIGKPSDERPDVITSSCTYSRYPCSLVDLITIEANGTSLFVPRAAFRNLADLNVIDVTVRQKKAVLTISGGDASESYSARIRFNRERITGMSVFDGESGKKLQETTFYRVVD